MSRSNIGKTIEYSRTFTETDIETFVSLSQDDNPIHTDEEYAANSIFKERIVPGILTASIFSKIFGTIYPVNGGIYVSQSLNFIKPVYLQQRITARVILIGFDEEKQRGTFTTECFDEESNLLLTGEATILFKSIEQ